MFHSKRLNLGYTFPPPPPHTWSALTSVFPRLPFLSLLPAFPSFKEKQHDIYRAFTSLSRYIYRSPLFSLSFCFPFIYTPSSFLIPSFPFFLFGSQFLICLLVFPYVLLSFLFLVFFFVTLNSVLPNVNSLPPNSS